MKKIINDIKSNYKLLIGVLVIGIVLGGILFRPSGDEAETQQKTEEHAEHEQAAEETTWTCSMHPQIREEEAGDCPICGMDLIPLSSVDNDGDPTNAEAVRMTEEAVSLANIQTSRVERGSPEKVIFLQGKVKADERNIAELTARFGGRIEQLFINFTGQDVSKGQKLANIYSPELVTAQRELLEVAALKESRPSLYNAAITRLKLWDLTDAQINKIVEQGEPKLYFDVLSPISGTVMQRHVAKGNYVKQGDPLFRIANLSSIWVMFDAYEDDLPWIRTGDLIEFTVRSVPAKTYQAKVRFIDPFIDPETRIAKVRVEVSNPGRKLKPEMFATARLYSEAAGAGDKLLIPASAILWTGKKAVVYVKSPDTESPAFLYREVELGPRAGNYYVVNDGLQEDEIIATNGVFKIDAAAQLEGKTSMMNPDDEAAVAHNYGKSQSDTERPVRAGSTPNAFKKQLTHVYDQYIKLKDAFVDSDPEKVKLKAKDLSDVLAKVDMELLQGSAHMKWMDQLDILKKNINIMKEEDSIEKQRKAFSNFNNAFYHSLKTFGLSNKLTYYQYCPMAFDDEGAYWFSNSKEIRNPYFGESMLKCGETKEEIK